MTCYECEVLLVAHIDRELDERQEEAVKAHLAACVECRSALAEYVTVRRALALWTELTVDKQMDEEVLSRVRQATVRRAPRHPNAELADKMRWWWLLPIVLASIFAGGFLLARPSATAWLAELLEDVAAPVLTVTLSILAISLSVATVVILLRTLTRREGPRGR